MNNIVRQYDWNNHKEINQKKLTNLFVKLKLADKLAVYRVLSDRRRLILRKGYEKWRQVQDREDFEKDKLFLLKPFIEDIDISDIKTGEELDLTIAMLLMTDYRAYIDYNTSNLSKEEESFERTKEKMIGWIGSIGMRNNPTARYQVDLENTIEHNLMLELEKLKYVAPTTLIQYRKIETSKWKECYIHIGVGEERAKRLAMGIGKQIVHYHDNKTDKVMMFEDWRDNINDDYRVTLSELLDSILPSI